MPTIDVALAAYNGEKYIEAQLDSILSNQIDTEDFILGSLLISDNASTDKTASIVAEYAKCYPNIELMTNKERGVMSNFAHALAKTKADYIMLSDQDDVWLNNKIQVSLQRLLEIETEFGKQCPILVFTDLFVTDDQLNIQSNSFFQAQKICPTDFESPAHLFLANITPGCSMLFNRSVLEMALPFPEGAVIHDWWLMLVASTFGKVAFIDVPTIMYRQHGNNQIGAPTKRYRAMLKSPIKQFQISRLRLANATRQAQEFRKRFTGYPERCSSAINFMADFGTLSRVGRLRGLVEKKIANRSLLKTIALYVLAIVT
ncbi:glycosyltransferase family 2 protein [Undibacterium sp. SXout11W]|uniref:glycosyltransferase family 2 protein n=1 Tax=Undibacterium sp. SXout11W TaxID=3413050 RepID=UPI003BF09C65